MISPTNGRVVLYTPYDTNDHLAQHDKTKPLAAIVTHVWHDRLVNLTVFDSNGMSQGRTSVKLLQDDDARPELGGFCEWMPYQKGQAAKTEAIEKELKGPPRPSSPLGHMPIG